MRILERRRQADRASIRVQRERAKWRAQTIRIRAFGTRHRELLTVGSGFVGGALAARLPWRGLARIGNFVGALFSLALRSPLGIALFENAAAARASGEEAADAGDG